jgi:polyisoprenyl-teichoic acid--peptidoglycan teichoic acid transferase
MEEVVVSRKFRPMRSGSPYGSFPSLTETVAALLLGVLIGLTITSLDRKYHFWHKLPPADSVQVAAGSSNSTTSNISLPSFNLLPSLDHRMNILVMGVDSNGRNTQRFLNTRSDTMMVVSVDPSAKKVSVVSIPRDSRVTIAGGHGEDKINSAHAYGGPALAVETVNDNFGVPIDKYVVVDAQGLKKLADIVGPVDILVEKKMNYVDHAAGLNVALKPGLQALTPAGVEEYVRYRHDAKGDIGRIERQQWFLRQVSKKLQDPSIILKLPDLYQCASQSVMTDLSVDEMAKLAAFGKDIKMSQIETATVPGKAIMFKGGSYWLPDYDGAALVFNRLCGANLSLPYTGSHFGDNDGPYAVQAAEVTDESNQAERPVTISIRYAHGSETDAKNLELTLNSFGYKVRSRVRADMADCQHEQVIQTSARLTAEYLDKLKNVVPTVEDFPTAINLDSQAPTDLTIVVSPQTHFAEPPVANLSGGRNTSSRVSGRI